MGISFAFQQPVHFKGIKVIVEMLGAFPIPTSMKGMKNFCESLEILMKKSLDVDYYDPLFVFVAYLIKV